MESGDGRVACAHTSGRRGVRSVLVSREGNIGAPVHVDAVLYFALAMPLLEQVLPKVGMPTPAMWQSSMRPASNHPVRVAQPIFVSSADGISTSFGREHGGVTSSVAAQA